jgi:hypothetical protein
MQTVENGVLPTAVELMHGILVVAKPGKHYQGAASSNSVKPAWCCPVYLCQCRP